jgi:transcriptional regulator with XRE-family HTH domain
MQVDPGEVCPPPASLRLSSASESNMKKEEDLGLILGKAAREARKALGLTQDSVAERLDLSVEFYGRLERGTARPSIEVFARMVAILDVSADTLLDLDAARTVEPSPLTRPDDPPELRELVELLCNARPSVLRLVSSLLHEFEPEHGDREPAGPRRRTARKRGRRTKKPPVVIQ